MGDRAIAKNIARCDVTEGNIFAIARSPTQYSFYYMANSRNLYLVLIHPVIKKYPNTNVMVQLNNALDIQS